MKKPGEFKAARQRHLAAQARSDALKQLREGEPTQVRALIEDDSSKLVEVRPFEGLEPFHGQKVLCVYGHKLRVMTFIENEGGQVADFYHGPANIPRKQIHGAVLKTHRPGDTP